MAPTTLYPRATLKKTLKAHANKPLAKNVDILVFLNYTLFLQEVMKEARIESKKAGERGVSARSVRKVRENCLRKFKG
ncbi:hypothetical protein BU24DRAFT_347756 [Aaosphaeria arxii CBS 175.79]|uniref:Transcription factor CBF/NF-Y/archaeal histone domain-containing protein n=1 Tax=Aaosphaeria arxii CBS 175.79 TaxID=1450172 RepID=A0A6A5XWW1_9PLEO|nr:uncharacterized protein BU24DRAFT_347756 [Aaosphaeria arxii CBS 175.79]KAF2016744.1 hypothetical protein BU24DRAFT_347756 [Aaosphaeria arxii CBS 175.79]